MRQQSRIIHRSFMPHGLCTVCGRPGFYPAFDTVLNEPVCQVDVEHLLSAEGLLEAWHLEHPSLELVRRNP